MKMFCAFAVSVIGGLFWAQVAVAGGPTMPCETGGTLHLTSKTTSECKGDDCTKLVAASTVGKEATKKK
jgi:hypothetical protein